jgi:hypothetical protein
MALLTVVAVWVAVSVPLALLAGRLLHATNPGLVSEIEAYLRRGRRRPVRRIAGMTATFLLLGGAAASATVATSRIPVVRSVTEWALDEVTGDVPASTTTAAPASSQQAAGVPDDGAEVAASAGVEMPSADPAPAEPPALTDLLLEGALAAEVPAPEVHEHEHEPAPVPEAVVPVALGPSAEAPSAEPAAAEEPPPAEELEPTEPEPELIEPEPELIEPEPELIEPEPELIEPEPELIEPEPELIEPLPLEPEPEPVLVEPLPIEPEPVLLEPEPIVEEPVFVAPEVIQPIPPSGFLFVEPEPTEPLEAPN